MTNEEYVNELIEIGNVLQIHPNSPKGKALKKAIELLRSGSFPEREKGEWIPVTEKLPEDVGDYIIDYTNEFGEFVGISHYDKYGFWSSSNVIA